MLLMALVFFCIVTLPLLPLLDMRRRFKAVMGVLVMDVLDAMTGRMLADVVIRKGVTASSLDGWGMAGVEGLAGCLV